RAPPSVWRATPWPLWRSRQESARSPRASDRGIPRSRRRSPDFARLSSLRRRFVVASPSPRSGTFRQNAAVGPATVLEAIDRERLRSAASPAGSSPGGSERHHRAADNLARPEELEIFVELVEGDGLDGVADLAFRSQDHDLAEVGVVPPE